MATRCPFGWKSRFQSNLSILEAKNVSAPCATQETLGQMLLRVTSITLDREWRGGGGVFAILSLQLYFINLIYKYQAIHFSSLGKLVFVLCAQEPSSPINIAIDGSVLPYFPPACSLSLCCSLLNFTLLFEPRKDSLWCLIFKIKLMLQYKLEINNYTIFITLPILGSNNRK